MITGTPTNIWNIERTIEVRCELPGYLRPRSHPLVTLSVLYENGLISSMLGGSQSSANSIESAQGPLLCLRLCKYIILSSCDAIGDQQTGYGALTTTRRAIAMMLRVTQKHHV